MQEPHAESRQLLTALEVQQALHIDRSTVYRMAEDGRLPAIRVGRSWRFPADRIAALLATPLPDDAPASPEIPTPPGTAAASGTALPGQADEPAREKPTGTGATLNAGAAAAAVEVAADLLGVMMVVTDMRGRPVTGVAHPCEWFAARQDDPSVLDSCVAEWHDLADHPDLTPRFQLGALGFECARAFIRSGSTLVGMVLAGGVSPTPDPTADADLYHLDQSQRDRVLAALPRIAAAISTQSTAPGRPTPPPAPPNAVATTASPAGATKEN